MPRGVGRTRADHQRTTRSEDGLDQVPEQAGRDGTELTHRLRESRFGAPSLDEQPDERGHGDDSQGDHRCQKRRIIVFVGEHKGNLGLA